MLLFLPTQQGEFLSLVQSRVTSKQQQVDVTSSSRGNPQAVKLDAFLPGPTAVV